MKNQMLLILFAFFLGMNSSYGQGTKADYERSQKLSALFANKVLNEKIVPHFYAENQKFWYDKQLPNKQHEFIGVHPQEKKKAPLFDHELLVKELNEQTRNSFKPNELPFHFVKVSEEKIEFSFQKKDWLWDPQLQKLSVTNEVSKIKNEDNTRSLSNSLLDKFRSQFRQREGRSRSNPKSPNQKWEVSIQNHNVFIKNLDTNETEQLSEDGSSDDTYQAEFFWSPDSTRLIVPKERAGDVHTVYMVESSPKDQVQPKLVSHQYLKPGDKIPWKKPHLFNIDGMREIKLDDKLFDNPWGTDSYQWSGDSRYFYFYYNQRGHQINRVLQINAENGEVRGIVDEVSPTFIDYAYKKFYRYLDQTQEILWASERDGWNHLYLYDAVTGQVKNQITKGNWVLREVLAVDNKQRQIWFTLSGYYPDQDPYQLHYARINFDGTGLTLLTAGNGMHDVLISPDNNYFIDSFSQVDQAPAHEVRSMENGELLLELERTDLKQLKETGWQIPERFVAKGRDGETDIYGIIIKPTNFDPKKKYPVIEYIYAGPHSAFVPKKFTAHFNMMKMAELGFILVQIDGMGTNHRGKKFHDVCWKNLGDSGFPDRILWMKAAAKDRPYMDLSRVGIYGGSAGGQSSTRAMLAHGDFYKVAVSDCGCHDNRMDKIWWNELWMCWPIGDHYKEQSNVTQAHKLQGKLLLVVGEVDHNVDPASTMQVVNALIKADKDFDFLIIPGADHGAAESPYGQRRRMDFFVRHLLGVEPRRE